MSTLRVLQCRYGMMCFFPHDRFIGVALDRYGEYSQAEVDLLLKYTPAGGVVVEAGSNIGAITLPLARAVGNSGRVFAFEPQRIIHQMLCANLALNVIWNTWAGHVALSNEVSADLSVPLVDYTESGNFGDVSLVREGNERIGTVQLDSFQLSRCDLIKIDVQGMEQEVLLGAANTIQSFRPVLYVENDQLHKSAALIDTVRQFGYDLWWHIAFMYNPKNFRGEEVDYFRNIASFNMLCLPCERAAELDMPIVKGPVPPKTGLP